MIKATCKNCGKKLEAPDEVAGKRGRCPECKAVFEITCDAALKEGQNWTSPFTGMEFVWIPAMNIWVGKYEVTNAEYRKKDPGHDSGSYEGHTLNQDRQPVVE